MLEDWNWKVEYTPARSSVLNAVEGCFNLIKLKIWDLRKKMTTK